MLARSIKTVQYISQMSNQKLVTTLCIVLDTIMGVLVLKNVLGGDLNVLKIAAMTCGYVSGFYVGSFIEDKMALGKVIVTIKVDKDSSKEMSKALRKNGFIFIQSKRHYTHKGKLRKLHQGIVFRKEIPKLKEVLKKYSFIATVQHVKSTFGKELISAEEYLRLQTEDNLEDL